MPQPDLRKQAQQGDPEAIALWLNHSLSAEGVTARVLVRDCCLKILLTADRSLEKQAYMQFLQRRLSRLALESIRSVRVYGQKIGEASPLWAQEFILPEQSIAVELTRTIDVKTVDVKTVDAKTVDVKTVEIKAINREPSAELNAESHGEPNAERQPASIETPCAKTSTTLPHPSIYANPSQQTYYQTAIDPSIQSSIDRLNKAQSVSSSQSPDSSRTAAEVSQSQARQFDRSNDTGSNNTDLPNTGSNDTDLLDTALPEVVTSLSHIPVFPVNAAVDASIEQLFKRDRLSRSRINSKPSYPSPATSNTARTHRRRVFPYSQRSNSSFNSPAPSHTSRLFPPPRPSRFAKFLRKPQPPTSCSPAAAPQPSLATSQIVLSPPRSLVQVAPQSLAPQSLAPQSSSAIVHIKSSALNFWTSLQTFDLATIFPYQEVFNRRLFHNHTVKLLLFLGLFPLVINLFAGQASPAQTAWLLGIYYASIWGVLFYNLIRPKHFSWGDTARCLLFTTFVGIPLLLYAQRIPPFNLLYHTVNADSAILRLLGFVFGVGLLEELCKALPVYLFLYRPAKLRDPQTAAFYGAMSGLGFAIAEGFTYSLVYASGLTKLFATGLSKGYLGLGSYVAANTIRLVSLPLFHAILAGIVGYFIGLAAINPSRRWAILTIGLAIAAILHGSYNTFAGSILGLFIIAFSILLFLTYLRRSQQMATEMRQAEESNR